MIEGHKSIILNKYTHRSEISIVDVFLVFPIQEQSRVLLLNSSDLIILSTNIFERTCWPTTYLLHSLRNTLPWHLLGRNICVCFGTFQNKSSQLNSLAPWLCVFDSVSVRVFVCIREREKERGGVCFWKKTCMLILQSDALLGNPWWDLSLLTT